MASKIATEKTFGVDERARQSAIQKQKEAIEERFGLTEGLLENYYNYSTGSIWIIWRTDKTLLVY